MNEIMRIVLSLSISGSILMLITFGLSKLMKERFSKAWLYYIWLIVIFRLLLPITPYVSPIGTLFDLIQPPTQNMSIDDSSERSPEEDPLDDNNLQSNLSILNSPETTSPALFTDNTLLQWTWILWLGVAMLLLVRKITLYQSFTIYIKAGNAEVSSPEILDKLGAVCEELNIRRQIDLYENPLISSPLILGIFKPAIVLPNAKISDSEFRFIVLHELTHYKRRDIFYKWLVQVTLCLHWFNPFVYWMAKEINQTCELSCDEAVIRSMDEKSKKAYGDVIIKSIQNSGKYKPTLAGVTLSENAQTVKVRLQAIMKYKKAKKSVFLVSIAIIAVLSVIGILIGSAKDNSKISSKDKHSEESSSFNDFIVWERFATEDLKETNSEPKIMKSVSYGITYDIKDQTAITTSQREKILQSVADDIHTWVDSRSEKEIFDNDLIDNFKVELDRVLSLHMTDNMTMAEDWVMIEGSAKPE